jgi:hypothetical protein
MMFCFGCSSIGKKMRCKEIFHTRRAGGPHLAQLEVAKRNQISKMEPPGSEITPNPPSAARLRHIAGTACRANAVEHRAAEELADEGDITA